MLLEFLVQCDPCVLFLFFFFIPRPLNLIKAFDIKLVICELHQHVYKVAIDLAVFCPTIEYKYKCGVCLLKFSDMLLSVSVFSANFK